MVGEIMFYNWYRPFYSRGLSTLAWPCFDTNLLCFVMEIVIEKYWLA